MPSSTLGSSAAWATSVSRLIATTMTANTSVTPCTTAKSRLKIAVEHERADAGRAKTRSTTSVLPTR